MGTFLSWTKCAFFGAFKKSWLFTSQDPRRVFGEAVEATGGTAGSAMTTQLARACTEAIANAASASKVQLSTILINVPAAVATCRSTMPLIPPDTIR